MATPLESTSFSFHIVGFSRVVYLFTRRSDETTICICKNRRFFRGHVIVLFSFFFFSFSISLSPFFLEISAEDLVMQEYHESSPLARFSRFLVDEA